MGNVMNDRSKPKGSRKPKLPGFPAAGAWERAWQKHWSTIGMPGYELPVGGRGSIERDFLTHPRTPERERARLRRINNEFIRGFRGLFHVGPAVTVFGSARFKPRHPYYRLARATGAELPRGAEIALELSDNAREFAEARPVERISQR